MRHDVVFIDMIGGNCPVQAEGTINKTVKFYFRARGEHWSLSVGGTDPVADPDFYYQRRYGTEPFAAGWMSEDEARAFIAEAADVYLKLNP